MILTTICVAMLVIAFCQCFHVFKVYNKLQVMEMLLNSIQNKINVKEIVKQQVVKKEIKKTGSPLFTRSEEQKKHASQKRKEWWERKRAEDALKAMQANQPQPVSQGLDH